MFVADSGCAALALLDRCKRLAITCVTRLRMDAGLFESAPARAPRTNGRPRVKGAKASTLEERLADPKTPWSRVRASKWYSHGERDIEIATGRSVWYHSGETPVPISWVLIRDPDGKFKPQALLSTDLDADPLQTLTWFMRRWQLEVTFQEVRTHLGVETQRQWSDKAIERTTPALLGLYSIIAMAAQKLDGRGPIAVRGAAWYQKEQATFSDAIAAVRRHIWSLSSFSMSMKNSDRQKPIHEIQAQTAHRSETMCYAI